MNVLIESKNYGSNLTHMAASKTDILTAGPSAKLLLQIRTHTCWHQPPKQVVDIGLSRENTEELENDGAQTFRRRLP